MKDAEDVRSRITLTEHSVLNVHTTDFPGNYPGYDDSWDFEKFKKKFKVKVIRLEGMEMEFDLIGADVAIANAFRRILIAEVPTMAIEKVGIRYNTSVIPDDVLAHRLGLIPIKADPRLFEYKQDGVVKKSADDTLEFTLKIKCTKNENATDEAIEPEDKYKDHLVYSKQLEWCPIGDQADLYKKNSIGPIHDDILIAKLRQGHELDLILHCFKGIGKDHAKFSPVATASYRLLPEISLTREVQGEQAEKLVKCFSPGVMELVEENGQTVAKVVNPRRDTCSRNVYRYEDLKDAVKMSRVRDHLIFSIESTGALPPDTLMVEAIKVLMAKCQLYITELDSAASGTST